MRIPTALAVIAIALAGVSFFGCKSGTSKPKAAVYFGPGSAPNRGAGIAGGGPGSFSSVAALFPASAQPDMVEPRIGHTATVLPDQRVLVVGGRTNDMGPVITQESEVYDPATGEWIQLSVLAVNNGGTANDGLMIDTNGNPTVRMEHSATLLPGGTVIIAGGAGSDHTTVVVATPVLGAMRSVFRFEHTNNTFASVLDMPEARYFHQGEVTINGDVLVHSGVAAFNGFPQVTNVTLKTAYVLDLQQNQWTKTAGDLGDSHSWGNTHLFQGVDQINNGVHLTAVPTNPQQPPPVMIVRGTNTGLFLPQGSVGGKFPGSNGEFLDLNQVPIASATFLPGQASSLREFPPSGIIMAGSASLSSGDVFFAGGETLATNIKANPGQPGTPLSNTEILRFATGLFEAGPDIGSSQAPLTLGQPPNQTQVPAPPIPVTEVECEEVGFTSDVIMMGGLINGAATPFAERYSYRFNIMIGPPISMGSARQGHRVVKIPGDRILIIGGYDDSQPPVILNSCEIWEQ